MITKSPVSTWGVNVGLFLPRRMVATWEARRPRVLLSASITHHLRSACACAGLALYDLGTGFIARTPRDTGLLKGAQLLQAGARSVKDRRGQNRIGSFVIHPPVPRPYTRPGA